MISKVKQELEIVLAVSSENDVLNRLDCQYKEVSEMSDDDRGFLNAIILRKKPKKLLEIGVSRGGSSIVILNAIQEIENAHLYSLDYNDRWYKNPDYATGDFVEHYPHLKKNWTLLMGGLALNFIERVKPGIDFCLIDTVHFNPGEILDFLMVLPFLSEDALVVFHDTKYHTYCYEKSRRWVEKGITNNLLMSSIHGKKYISTTLAYKDSIFTNIGAVSLNSNTTKHLFEVFNLLTIKWDNPPSFEEEDAILNFFKKYYDEIFIQYLSAVFTHHRKYIQIIQKESIPEKENVLIKLKRLMRSLIRS